MAPPVSWLDDVRPLQCRVCERSGSGRLIAEVNALGQVGLEAVQCPDCRSIQLVDDPLASSPSDATVDAYVEGGAGIGSIARGLLRVEPATVRRFLDVGCNYGFALDLGSFLYGWDGVGVEPSLAGRRGAAELGLDIRGEYLSDESAIGADFDLILASEVVEHVTEPLAFVRLLGRRLAPQGTLVLTTPAAEIVSPREPQAEALAAMSPGYHVFVASREGLELLLRRAGFASVAVVRERGTLRAAASYDPNAALDRHHDGSVPATDLERYYRARSTTRAGSALANGMATRYVRSLVGRGALAEAADAAGLMIEALRVRHGLDLDDPAGTRQAIDGGHEIPWNLAGAAFALGMLDLLHHIRPARAADYFAVAGRAVEGWEDKVGILDLDSVDLRFQAPAHRALALAQVRPEAAVEAALGLGQHIDSSAAAAAQSLAVRQSRVYVELVARGHYELGDSFTSLVADRARRLAQSDDHETRAAGLDALFSLGIATLNTAQFAVARRWFTYCLHLCESRPSDDPHAAHLAESCRSHIGIAASYGAVDEPTILLWERLGPAHHAIDVYWCDAYGVYLEGWAHLERLAVDQITVRVGDHALTVDPRPTPHLRQYWPDAPEVERAGFAVYLAASPHGVVSLTLHSRWGRHDIELDLPASPLPDLCELNPMDSIDEVIAKHIEAAPAGPVLAIGVRSTTEDLLATRMAIFGDRVVTTVDIHPGIGVDVVGDVHRLSRLFPAEEFAVVFSSSVLEHVAAPWLVAAECAKVLKRGGLAIQAAPWLWPTHSSPNDFWRFSREGLVQLFGPATGFRLVDSGAVAAAVVTPGPNWRSNALKMPTTASPAASWVVAEKFTDSAAEWPYDAEAGRRLAQQYPVDALAVTPTEVVS